MPAPNVKKKVMVPKGFGQVSVRADTLNEEARTVEVIWSTGAAVKRYDWAEGGHYMEELSMDPGAIRMERFNSGMSLLDSHDNWSMKSRLGTVVPGSVKVEGGKGVALVRFSTSEDADVIFRDLVAGHPIQISVGYRIHAYEKIDGSDGALPVLRAIDWEPLELSVVPIPADPGAFSRSEPGHRQAADPHECTLIIRGQEEDPAEADVQTETKMKKRDAAKTYKGNQLDALALGAGVVRRDGETDDQLRVRLIEVYDDENAAREAADGNAEGGEPTAAAQTSGADEARSQPRGQRNGLTAADIDAAAKRAVAEDRTRRNDIEALARNAHFDTAETFVRNALDTGTSVSDFRVALTDQMIARYDRAPTFPHIETRGMRDAQETQRSQIANAILHRYNVVDTLMEGANEWRAMSALDIARELLRQRGEDTRGSVHEIVQRSLHTSGDFPIILGEITRQTLVAGYETYENTFEAIAHRNIVTDFREVKALEMGDAPDLEKVNEHGEFKRGTVKESQEGFQIASYGKIIGLTRRMIINDQLGAFTRLIADWGAKAAKLEGDIVWDVIIKNAKLKTGTTLFHASHGNVAGTGTVLDQSNLEAAQIAFRKMKNIDGEPIKISPSFLYTGTNLSVQAERQTGAVFTPNTVDATIANSTRALTPVYEPRIDEIPTKAWFLFANRQNTSGRGLQYAYLAGHERPRFEDRLGFDVDGIEYKIAHDFGAGLTDYRFGYKNPGVA